MIFQLTLANGHTHQFRGTDLVDVLRRLARAHGTQHPIINIAIQLEATDAQ